MGLQKLMMVTMINDYEPINNGMIIISDWWLMINGESLSMVNNYNIL